jgi:hypothetical protein
MPHSRRGKVPKHVEEQAAPSRAPAPAPASNETAILAAEAAVAAAMVAATVVVAEAADLRLARAKLAVIETRNAAEEAVRIARLAAFDALTAETAAQAACDAASMARSRASDEVGDGSAFQGFTSVTLMDNDNNDIVDDRLARLFADNEGNKAIDALFIVAQHDGGKWADECRLVKDLCCATRVETGLWSSMARVGYGWRKRTLLMWEAYSGRLDRVQCNGFWRMVCRGMRVILGVGRL